MEYAFLTDTGKVRETNEDCVTIVTNRNNEYLMLVCDGMGGHTGGEIASNIAINHISSRFENISSVGNKQDAINFLKDIVSEANMKLYRYTLEHEESNGMGTTLSLALLTKNFLLLGNIGDSSGFVIKKNKLQKITVDHTLVNLLLKSGEISLEEAKNHPRKNVLLKALGAQNTIEMDVFDVEKEIDGIFLCSDGLTNMLELQQIEKVLNENLSAEEKVKKLIIKANNRGGTDNISVAYLKVVE